jgi:hypothetical protein
MHHFICCAILHFAFTQYQPSTQRTSHRLHMNINLQKTLAPLWPNLSSQIVWKIKWFYEMTLANRTIYNFSFILTCFRITADVLHPLLPEKSLVFSCMIDCALFSPSLSQNPHLCVV